MGPDSLLILFSFCCSIVHWILCVAEEKKVTRRWIPAAQLALLTGIWFLLQKIQSWCELNDIWLTENHCGHSGFVWGFFGEGNNRHKDLWTPRRIRAWPLFISLCVEPMKIWVFPSSACLCYLKKGFCRTTAWVLCYWQILFVGVCFTGDLMQRW